MRVKISIVAGSARGQYFVFDKPDRFLFGRALDARVSLPNDPYVSRQHFLLEISPPACKLTDLGSKNGTLVNGIRYGGRNVSAERGRHAPDALRDVVLNDGDTIVVGDTQMKVQILDLPAPQTKDEPGTSDPLPEGSRDQKQEHSSPMEILGKLLRDAAKPHEASKPKQQERLQAPSPVSSRKSGRDFPTIDGYEIERIIDRGGMGIVYKGVNSKTRRPVAIKVMLPQMATNPDNIYTFKREIDVTRQLQHPNIVQLYDHGKTRNVLYFVLEYICGMNLHQFLEQRGRPLPLDEAASLMLDSLDGLAYAHYAAVQVKIAKGKLENYIGIVHRDLKPQNVLLDHNGRIWQAKISDFGISKSFESAGFTNITKPGEVLGTPMYWPREQITHYKYLNPATDVFSIAAVFYEMLTGRWVREGFEALFERCKKQRRVAAISDYMQIIVGNPAIPIRQCNPSLPGSVAKVLDRALLEAEVPYDERKMRNALAQLRYPDAKAFKHALQQAFEESGLSTERIHEARLRLGADRQSSPRPPLNASMKKSKRSGNAQKVKNLQENLAGKKAEGTVFFSSAQGSPNSKEVALLVYGIEELSDYLCNIGDTYFSKTISRLYKRVRQHKSSSDVMLIKSTTDGFLAVFSSMPSAFSLAVSFLRDPIQADVQNRMALHWGAVKLTEDGDVLGVEVHRVFRIEAIQMPDQVNSDYDGLPIPATNRIVMTEPALKQLQKPQRSVFHYAGQYALKGFSEPCPLWVLHKRSR
ncbi:hypothetical protein CSB45_01340 [candidate division KSB3 bacterium]|uniref:Uncharacterized protein n=1 Tax=candidate division KSB3 bacterium TaxID=2044937 RepID=A0A2G6EBE3_9BACT|nr:MAG: hypothetical protein CSB45_01340 [candidate division KSB3 bacterium]PIE30760.1 MAG: hypothetical protein CSA57_02010 [candidate division KSB3 bacterium]